MRSEGGGGSARTDRGDGGDDFSQLQLVQDGGLTGGIESDHQDSYERSIMSGTINIEDR